MPKKQSDEPVPAPAPAPAAEQPAPGVYVVAGRSVICKSGVLDEGDGPLKDEQFSGGSDTVEKLVKSGHLERK